MLASPSHVCHTLGFVGRTTAISCAISRTINHAESARTCTMLGNARRVVKKGFRALSTTSTAIEEQNQQHEWKQFGQLASRRLRTLLPLPGNNATARLTNYASLASTFRASNVQSTDDFEFAEHGYLGDSLLLSLADGSQKVAKDVNIKFSNGVNLTYGQINGLAGDFYGTHEPISDGVTLEERSRRFIAAFNTLNIGNSRTPEEVRLIMKELKEEIDEVNKAVDEGKDPSIIYDELPDKSFTFFKLTYWRDHNVPSYLGLAMINWDHFGSKAFTAYAAGHKVALDIAVSENSDLMVAYAMNAFADHFLEDMFSAGHMRTPRKELHNRGDADICAKLMHDEECAIGLQVSNLSGDTWTAFGDKRLLDHGNKQNLSACRNALMASTQSIYDAWKSKTLPRDNTSVFRYVPFPKQQQELAPLFKKNLERRSDITDRRTQQYTLGYTYAGTIAKAHTSHRWKYPITLDSST